MKLSDYNSIPFCVARESLILCLSNPNPLAQKLQTQTGEVVCNSAGVLLCMSFTCTYHSTIALRFPVALRLRQPCTRHNPKVQLPPAVSDGGTWTGTTCAPCAPHQACKAYTATNGGLLHFLATASCCCQAPMPPTCSRLECASAAQCGSTVPSSTAFERIRSMWVQLRCLRKLILTCSVGNP